jgi:hypothetical protein
VHGKQGNFIAISNVLRIISFDKKQLNMLSQSISPAFLQASLNTMFFVLKILQPSF